MCLRIRYFQPKRKVTNVSKRVEKRSHVAKKEKWGKININGFLYDVDGAEVAVTCVLGI